MSEQLAEELELWPSGFRLSGHYGYGVSLVCVRCDGRADVDDLGGDFAKAAEWVESHRCPDPEDAS